MFDWIRRIFPAAPNYSMLAIDRISADLQKDVPLLQARIAGVEKEIDRTIAEKNALVIVAENKLNELTAKKLGYESKLALVRNVLEAQ